MIKQIYMADNAVIKVRIEGKVIRFTNIDYSFRLWFPIEKLFNVAGFIKEFPELQGRSSDEIMAYGLKKWREELDRLGTEDNIATYVKEQFRTKLGLVLTRQENILNESK